MEQQPTFRILPSRLSTMVAPWLALALLAGAPVSRAGDEDCFDSNGRAIRIGGTSGVVALDVADIDGDMDLDILSASFGDDTIAWHENDLDPLGLDAGGPRTLTFTRHVISEFADSAAAVVAHDLDKDGDMDVVSASSNDDTIAWYANVGDTDQPPVFIPRTISIDADGAADVFVADVNGDGFPDVLSASIDDDKISWYEHDGVVPTKGSPTSSPKFTEHVVTTSANGAVSVYAADLNGDDKIDIVSASGLDNKIAWYEQSADTETEEIVWIAHVITTTAIGATDVVAVDLDQDGDIDVVSASAADGRIAWYRSDGATGETVPTFTKQIVATDVTGARAVHVVKFNNDTSFDILATAGTANQVVWFQNLNTGAGEPDFADKQIISDTILSPDAIITGDLDTPISEGMAPGFGVDVIVAASVPGRPARADRIAWFPNDDPFTPSEQLVSIGAIAPSAVLAVELNDDVAPDVVVASIDNDMIAWYESNGLGATDPDLLQFTMRPIDMGADEPTSVFVADLNDDGDPDVLATAAGDNLILWYENEGGATPMFATRRVISANAEGASSVFAIDLDGDDDIDVLSASRDDDKIAWYESNLKDPVTGLIVNDPPSFTERVISEGADGARSVFAIDIDGDGDIDVLSASSGDSKIAWYESDLNPPPPGLGPEPPGPPTFTEHVISLFSIGARAVFAADIDNDGPCPEPTGEDPDPICSEDGDIDVLAASAGDNTVSWFEQSQVEVLDEETQRPTGEIEIVWAERAVILSANFARTVTAAQFNPQEEQPDGSGGRLDVLAASSGDDTVAWFENVAPNPDIPDAPTTFTERVISNRLDEVRAVSVADMNGDAVLDVVTGYFFGVAWHSGAEEEQCPLFDANGDMRIDGIELTFLGAAFGEACVDPVAPSEWWATGSGNDVDFDDNCMIDGNDLSILTGRGVWGKGIDECSFTCQDATLIEPPESSSP